jgi:hypothetical protein
MVVFLFWNKIPKFGPTSLQSMSSRVCIQNKDHLGGDNLSEKVMLGITFILIVFFQEDWP